ncbi:MAG: GntR family transcriptional regulator [Eubacteriales bacterium]|jgi:GntR family transcriptional regulator
MPGKIERGKTLSEQAYELLCERIRNMPRGNNRLPSEEELSREYGVSRATIREACNQLIGEGYVEKLPGRGMLAHPSAFAMENRIDLISDFSQMMRQKYKTVERTICHVQVREEARMQAGHPWSRMQGPVLTMDWTYWGDGKKVIYSPFEIPLSNFRELPQEGFQVRDLLDFGERYLKVPLSYCAIYVQCGFAPHAAREFGLEAGQPLVSWQETLFDIEDNPSGYNTFYLNPQEMTMSLITKF